MSFSPLDTEDYADLRQVLLTWLAISPVREQRRYLENHLELFTLQDETIQGDLVAQVTEPIKSVQLLRDAFLLLQDVRIRGITVEGIREAYVNAFGAFALDIPPWLEEVEQRLLPLLHEEKLDQTAETRITLLQDALEHAKADASVVPEMLATIYRELARAWWKRFRTNGAQAFEIALSLCNEIFNVYTITRYPHQYALTHYVQGNMYRDYIASDRRENLEQAIVCYLEALRVLTYEEFPYDYASVQAGLGSAYEQRIANEQRENLERAIVCYHEALRVLTYEEFSYHYALVQINLAIVYQQRIVGERQENLERAIACYHQALRVLTYEEFPYDYGRTQTNLGISYQHRILGERQENLEQAINCYLEGLRVLTYEEFPYAYAITQTNLGDIYSSERVVGERWENLEQAIICFRNALRVFTYEAFPYEYGITQNNLANTYRHRIRGERQDNLEQAIACYFEALRVLTYESSPREFRNVQLDIAEAEAQRNNWVAAHTAYASSLEAEDLMVALGAGVVGQDAILKEGRSAAGRAGYALTRLGKVEEAIVAIERGRARSLAEALAFDTSNPEHIKDIKRRARYNATRETFIAAQAALQEPFDADIEDDILRRLTLERTAFYREAKTKFDAVVEEIRSAHDPADFLSASIDAATIMKAAERCGPRHGVVYLVATPWGGIAVGAFSAHPDLSTSACFAFCDLPALTDDLVSTLIETRLPQNTDRVIGGFDCAQQWGAFNLLQHWPGTSLQEKAAALHRACEEAGYQGTLDMALQEVLAIPNGNLAQLLDQPLDTLDVTNTTLLTGILNLELLQAEIKRCLSSLVDVILHPLLQWLREQETASLTLIPCGSLAAFPLLAFPIDDTSMQTLSELIPTSVAPSARSLLHAEYLDSARTGVYTLGNPYPTHQILEWGEAEALTLKIIAEQHDISSHATVQWDATRIALMEALRTSRIVDACCHGMFDAHDFLNSRLLLANGEVLKLADVLNRQVDLYGLRLLILSACQTALLDLRGARDEVRSLAAGMLQAGAEAVLATLWPVDDEATYLLIVRFALEWFHKMDDEPPAAALARAQKWLRTITNSELQEWRAQFLSTPLATDGLMPIAVGARRSFAVRGGRGYRLEAEQAEEFIQRKASRSAPNIQPYADPYYWAGFQITGW